MHHQKIKKCTKCLKKKTFSFLVRLEFLNNKHRCMKVVDVMGEICWFTTKSKSFVEGFLFQISNSKLKSSYILVAHMLALLIWLLWHTCLLNVNCWKEKKSLTIHLEFLYNRHWPMIGLKELAFVNETIKCLGYKTSRYRKVDPYVHPNWICNTIYTLLFISFQK